MIKVWLKTNAHASAIKKLSESTGAKLIEVIDFGTQSHIFEINCNIFYLVPDDARVINYDDTYMSADQYRQGYCNYCHKNCFSECCVIA